MPQAVYTSNAFLTVKEFLLDMGVSIVQEDPAEQLFVVDKEEDGIKHMIIDCEDDILVIEQAIMPYAGCTPACCTRLLQMNRELLHGAFCLDAASNTLLYRDTLQLASLDRNELEASVQSLSLALAEFSAELLSFIKA
ncbi:YbjN domain-containing protein [Megalodesulfovibrio paquesii]